MAFLVVATSGVNVSYTNGSNVGDVYSADHNLEILEGHGSQYPFEDDYSPRVFNGTVHYTINDNNLITWSNGKKQKSISPTVTAQSTFTATYQGKTETITIDVDPTCKVSSIGEVNFEMVEIYPNPSNGRIKIELGELKQAEINVYSITGELLSSTASDGDFTMLDITQGAGIYLVELKSGNDKRQYKVVVN